MSLREEVSQLKTEMKVHDQQLEAAYAEVKKVKKEFEELTKYNRQLLRQYGSTLLQTELRKREAKIKALEGKVKQLGLQTQKRKDQIVQGTIEKNIVTRAFEGLKKVNDKLKGVFKTLQEENNNLKDALFRNEVQYEKGINLKEEKC
ncbi:hypothetical protein PTKIN_Ptkin06aG0222800 [Pterospermum kingtungense]